MTKLENTISEYFQMICPLTYERFEFRNGLMDVLGIVIIEIYVSSKEYDQYLKKERGRGKKTVREMIKEDMSDMFPYVFVIELKTV